MAQRLTKEEKISRIMTGLHCDRAEAEDVYAYDLKVDREEATEYELTPQQQKVAKEYTATGTRKAPAVYKFDTKTRKPNATKREVISGLASFLESGAEFETSDIKIENPEKEILLKIGGDWYSVTLTYRRNLNKKGN